MPKGFFSSNDLDIIRNLSDSYSTDYRFAKGSIYYDCKANPLKRIKAYYRLSSMCEALQNKPFNCFSLGKGFIPSYMASDTYILNTQILKNSIISHLDKEVVWEAILDVTSKAIKPQGERKFIKFRGTIYTDGVGVSVLKQNYDTKRKGGSSSGKSKSIEADEFQYVEKLGKEELLAGVGKCALIHPDRRGLLYCMHENSTVEYKTIYGYTSNRNQIQKIQEVQEQLEKRRSDCSRAFSAAFQIFNCQQRQVCRVSSRKSQSHPFMKAYYFK